MVSMDRNERLSHFISKLTWQDIPFDAQRQAKLCLTDALATTLSGTVTRISQIAAEYAAKVWGANEATILGYGLRSTAAGAAFANGYAANAFDSDDVGKYTKGHPGAQIFPTALAVTEKTGKSGAEMLTAMVIGYEIAHRTARCWHDHHEIYQACGSWGSVANAAVAAHLMELDPKEIYNALGIAEYHAPNLPMMRDIDHPTMVKHGIGWGAFTGITAAELASRGFTGIPSILSFPKYEAWVDDISAHYIMAEPGGVLFKEYCCCGWAHAALDAVQVLVRHHDIKPHEITNIQVNGFHEMVRLGSDLPSTTEEAQFNLAWPLTMLILDGQVGPQQMLKERLRDEKAIELMRKIKLVESQKYTELAHLMNAGDPSGKYVCDVEIFLNDGRSYNSGPHSGGIDFSQTWDETRVEEKFHWLTSHTLTNAQIEKTLSLVKRFEYITNVSTLTDLLDKSC